jgi:hypothetical protein
VAAVSIDGEKFFARLHQQYFLVADMAEQLSACQLRLGDSGGQVRAAGRGLVLGHAFSRRDYPSGQ